MRFLNYIKSDLIVFFIMKFIGIVIVLIEIEYYVYINLNFKIIKFGWIEMLEVIGS